MLIQQTPSELGGRVWMLGATAYPVYLIRGVKEGAIVEGGISALGPVLAAQLAGLGIAADYVRQAVVTHAHPDHVMAIPTLREMFPGLKVIASAPAAATLAAEKAVAFFQKIDGALTQALKGTAPFSSNENQDRPPPAIPENRIAVDRTVREGDTIAVEDRSWQVLETPGHSDCSISLFEKSRGVLIISDASGYYDAPAGTWWPNYFTDYAAYVSSLERLATLDAEVLCLSHNGAVTGRDAVRDYFAGALAATRQYHERIVAETHAGKPARQLSEELGAEIHRSTPVLPVDFFQKNCSLLVKQSLKHAGLASQG